MKLRIDDIGYGGLKLIQSPGAFCYGTDAVLLADFARASRTDRVAELGSGNGAASFILWGKYRPAHITGIEFQHDAAELARQSAELNGLSSVIEFIEADVLDTEAILPAGSMDLVISNPPYTEKGRGPVNPSGPLQLARHETTAGLEDFIRVASVLLRLRGRLCMVHRPSRLADIICLSRAWGLEPKRLQMVRPFAGEAANIMLIECVKGGGKELAVLPDLAVRNADESYTIAMQSIYNTFLTEQ